MGTNNPLHDDDPLRSLAQLLPTDSHEAMAVAFYLTHVSAHNDLFFLSQNPPSWSTSVRQISESTLLSPTQVRTALMMLAYVEAIAVGGDIAQAQNLTITLLILDDDTPTSGEEHEVGDLARAHQILQREIGFDPTYAARCVQALSAIWREKHAAQHPGSEPAPQEEAHGVLQLAQRVRDGLSEDQLPQFMMDMYQRAEALSVGNSPTTRA